MSTRAAAVRTRTRIAVRKSDEGGELAARGLDHWQAGEDRIAIAFWCALGLYRGEMEVAIAERAGD